MGPGWNILTTRVLLVCLNEGLESNHIVGIWVCVKILPPHDGAPFGVTPKGLPSRTARERERKRERERASV